MRRARGLGRDFVHTDLTVDAERRILVGGVEVVYASIARLLELKAGTGRPKDVMDIVVLTEIRQGLREPQSVDLAAMEPDPAANPSEQDQGERPLETS